jgi:hypothetical protein
LPKTEIFNSGDRYAQYLRKAFWKRKKKVVVISCHQSPSIIYIVINKTLSSIIFVKHKWSSLTIVTKVQSHYTTVKNFMSL